MTKSNFPFIMSHIFREEGGYVDHPSDPGGATNLGITFAVLQDWRGHAITNADVKKLTKAEAQKIYEQRYWTPIKGDILPSGIDLVTMDGSVNSGIGRGPKWVQTALGVTADGKVGPATLLAASNCDPVKVINAACDARLTFLKGLKTWPTFGKGWQARVERVRKEALAMAKKPAYVDPLPMPPDTPIVLPPLPESQSKGGVGWIALAALVVVGVLVAIALFTPIF